MALISLLLACRDAPPGPRPDLCPGLDWVVHLSTSFDDEVTDVVALPGGDVLVAGRHGGAARIGTGEEDLLPPALTLYNPFVARLGPDGAMRWSHTLGATWASSPGRLTVDTTGFWFAGEEEGGGLFLDGVRLTEPATPADGVDPEDDPYAVRFDLDGRFERVVSFRWPGSQQGKVAVSDPAGNVLLLGWFNSADIGLPGAEVGPFPNGRPEGPSGGVDLFVAAFDPEGRPSWLSKLGEFGAEGGTYSSGHGGWWGPGGPRLATRVAVASPNPGPLWSTLHDGPLTNPLEPGLLTNHFTYDLATATLSELPFGLHGADLRRLRPGRRPGTFLAVGEIAAPATFVGANGESRDIVTAVEGGHVAFVGEFDSDGQFLSLTTGNYFADGGDRTPDGDAALAGMNTGHPIAPGLPGLDTFVDGHRDAYVARFRDDHLQCAWAFTGPDNQDLRDAAVDDLGGVVVGGTFDLGFEIRDFDGNLLHEVEGAEGGYTGGVIARFLPPEE